MENKNLGLLVLIGIPVVILLTISNVSSDKSKDSAAVEPLSAVQGTTTKVANEEPQSTDIKSTVKLDMNKKYIAVLNTTEGEIKIELNSTKTPITANNFVELIKKGFYNNTVFHRVIKGFMIQGGDPTGTGSGGPGYRFNDEPFEGEYTRGTVAMANAGPNTNGSQFFIMHQTNALPKNYTIFGQVVDGMDVVDKIASASVKQSPNGEMSSPASPIKIVAATVLEE